MASGTQPSSLTTSAANSPALERSSSRRARSNTRLLTDQLTKLSLANINVSQSLSTESTASAPSLAESAHTPRNLRIAVQHLNRLEVTDSDQSTGSAHPSPLLQNRGSSSHKVRKLRAQPQEYKIPEGFLRPTYEIPHDFKRAHMFAIRSKKPKPPNTTGENNNDDNDAYNSDTPDSDDSLEMLEGVLHTSVKPEKKPMAFDLFWPISECDPVNSNLSPSTSSSPSSASTSAISPAQKTELENLIAARVDKVRIDTALVGTSCNFSYKHMYNTIWRGLDELPREQFWVAQIARYNDIQIFALLPSNEDDTTTDDSSTSSSRPGFSNITDPSVDDLLQRGILSEKVYNSIVIDVYRTFPSIEKRRKGFPDDLYRGLVAYAIYRPDIGYGQGMNQIFGAIILCIKSAAHHIRLMEHITRRILPFYFDADSVGFLIDSSVLVQFIKDKRKKLCAHIETHLKVPISFVAESIVSKWMSRLYLNILRGSEVLRLWDLVMLRGAVVLFEFSISILNYAYKRNLFESTGDICPFLMSLQEKLGTLESIDLILPTWDSDDMIDETDFQLKRSAMTRIEFEKLQKGVSMASVKPPKNTQSVVEKK